MKYLSNFPENFESPKKQLHGPKAYVWPEQENSVIVVFAHENQHISHLIIVKDISLILIGQCRDLIV